MHKRPHGRNTLVEGDPLIAGTGRTRLPDVWRRIVGQMHGVKACGAWRWRPDRGCG